MSLSLFTNWAVGLINGYKQKENGLPSGIKYGTMGITTSVAMFKTLANWDTPAKVTNGFISAVPTPGQKLFGLFVGVPLVMGMNFCVGHHMGKAIRFAEDEPRSGQSGIRLQLL
jgi:hypothetical protein